ncbi:probable cytochrome P450 CYP44 [Lingula anatina]|uniref:Probable cytochrome P450 CYP44 n=1 Tax=Lingula anatina TaxID=7574 RepID=A0A1S3HFB1_LINAN|nr:probable cytochrome P450 CYP44 [Lingula anatina]|eukprot:XP_013383719.1 probable cytochrome P450 CYP44 [Lingula anatina]
MREILKSLHHNYGPVVKETRSGDTFVHLFHLDDICGVLRNSQVQTDVYPLFPPLGFYRRWRRIGPGIGNVNGEEWRTLRGLVQSHILRPNIVADYLPFINEVADDFLTRLPGIQTANGEVPNLYEEVAKWHLKSTARNVFETHPGFFDNEVNEFFDVRSMIEATQTVVRSATGLYYSLPLYRYVRTAQWNTMVESADYLFGGLQKLLDRAVEDIKVLSATNQLPDDKYSFLRHVMSRSGDIPYSEWGMLSLDMVFDGLIATPAVLIWNLFTLSKHSHVQDKLFEEVERIVPRGENVTKDHIKKMKYMKAFLKETSRFFPLTVELTRIPQQDTVVGGYHIPMGNFYLRSNKIIWTPQHKAFDME